MYRNNSFSLNHARHGVFSSLFKGCLALISNTALVSSRVRAEHGNSEPQSTCRVKDYTCLTEHHDTCMKCLHQQIFFPHYSLTVLPFGVGDFNLFLSLQQAISSIGSGINIIRVIMSVPQLLAPHAPPYPVREYLESRSACARCWFLQLKSPRDLSLPKLRVHSLRGKIR